MNGASTLLSAREAAARLGVTVPTLYAYVSRGLLKAYNGPTSRERGYNAHAVDRLAAARRRGRRPKEVARATLDWGVPVLESSISLIRDGCVYYRGVDAIALSKAASVEDTAALLWALPREAAFGGVPSPQAMGALETMSILQRFALSPDFADNVLWIPDPARLASECGSVLRYLAACVFRHAPASDPLHIQCARAWSLDKAASELVRKAFILCADHELSASSFTARCVASTGASLHACVLAGLTALSGARHGGISARIDAFWDRVDFTATDVSVRSMLSRGEELPGFGHPLYVDCDPRGAEIMSSVTSRDAKAAALVAAVLRLTGRRPSLEFALVALRRCLGLPPDTAFGIFALGRCLGWIAHALEQREQNQLIRPRATYIGKRPRL